MPIPIDFHQRALKYAHIQADKLLRIFRLDPTQHPNAVYYSKSGKNRFDSPTTLPPTYRYGVTYAAFDLPTCFAETVTREDNLKALSSGGILVSQSAQLVPRYVAHLQASIPLRLADVTDIGLYSLGAEAGEFNSAIYSNTTQPWSLELHNRPEQVDGLLYRSRFLNGRLAVAIFERGGLRVQLQSAQVINLPHHRDYANTLNDLNIYLIP